MDYVEDEHGNLTTVYTTANIEDIQVGDLVYSYNTLTGETELAEVTSTVSLSSNHINYLTIIDEHGNEQVIESTDVHPFWVVTDDPDLDRAARSVVDENGVTLYHENLEPGMNGFWVEAKDLRIGDVFLGPNGERLTVISTVRENFPGGIAVYNFEVAGTSCYYVIANTDAHTDNASPVLVHNMCAQKKKSDHAKLRGQQGRPIGTAFRDAQKATDSQIYVQPDGRYFLAGPKGRNHIFEADGEYVTMVRRSAEAIRGKFKRGEIERPTDIQLENFRQLFD